MSQTLRLSSRGMTGHHRPNEGESVEWLTPPEILHALGQFHLDPCCPADMPWNTADFAISPPQDGLGANWFGRVWMNPPYGSAALGPWLEKLAEHGNGIALVFARTETKAFHSYGWQRASGMLFLRGRLHFHRLDGIKAKANAGAPSVLIAYGHANANVLRTCGIAGHYVPLGGVR